MSKPLPDDTYRRHGRRWSFVAAAFWLAFAIAVVGLSVAGLASGLPGISVAEPRRFPGQIRPAEDPVSINLPAGIPLQAVLVSPGDEVAAGETLVTFDRVVIQARLAALTLDLTELTARRACLMRADVPEREKLGEEEAARLTLAKEECALILAEKAAEREQLDAAIDHLQERFTLLQRKLDLLTSQVFDSADTARRQARAKIALDLALQRNEIAGKLTTLENRKTDLDLSTRRAALRRAQELTAEISRLQEKLATLSYFKDAPRIAAPQAGRVTRVRSLAPGTELQEDAPLLQLRGTTSVGHLAYFTIDPHVAEQLETGTSVRLKMLGLRGRDALLSGTVAAIEATDREDELRALVQLDAASATRLDNPQEGLALVGQNTASSIEVALSPMPVVDVLRSVASSHLHEFQRLSFALSN
ncbi:hypothetical protein ACMU_05720 [Actibacterium mucosum KCTC 23349]|uniref:Membrane fusion protein biotin-lipoyl like domain-containing protein n=1 Tax=Actibacterium mucosum KCTC 23349 TaxID=1454373 RepID=A0A037ZJ56_9RHOB|nr:hypothetical protein [Actibacterium mucosum]KAJ56440.1 hypothetical protein ACMU_05720 [Actibacterium mucosum KCTC 23349]